MLGAVDLAAQGQPGAGVPKRPLGRTGLEVSILELADTTSARWTPTLKPPKLSTRPWTRE